MLDHRGRSYRLGTRLTIGVVGTDVVDPGDFDVLVRRSVEDIIVRSKVSVPEFQKRSYEQSPGYVGGNPPT